VQSACDALGLPPPPAHVAAALAADVEYRIRDLVQGAAAYMRHAKRSQLTTADVDRAMREKNVEVSGRPAACARRSQTERSRAAQAPCALERRKLHEADIAMLASSRLSAHHWHALRLLCLTLLRHTAHLRLPLAVARPLLHFCACLALLPARADAQRAHARTQRR
jgi:hypothetical protein